MGSVSGNFVGGGGGLLMSIIAFSIVFLVIIGLMLLMMGLKHFAAAANREKADAPAQTAPVPGTAPEPTPPGTTQATAMPATASASAEDEELVAVITAAITAATGVAAKVLSFAPSQPNEAGTGRGTSAWRMTGILSNSRGLRD